MSVPGRRDDGGCGSSVQTRCAASGRDGSRAPLPRTNGTPVISLTHSHYCTPPPPSRLVSSPLLSLYSHSHHSSQLLRQHFCHGNLIRILLLLMERQSAYPLLYGFLNRLPIVYHVKTALVKGVSSSTFALLLHLGLR